MDRPQLSPPPRSNVLVYVVLVLFSLGALAFLYLLFGELFLLAAVAIVAVAIVGGLHYILWGRGMTESAKKEAKANLDEE